jgi:hypothetical protein
VVAAVVAAFIVQAFADAPPAPKQSTVASAEVLTAAANEYLADLNPLLVDEATFMKSIDQVGFKANAVTALALVLGNHDGASPLKGAATEIIAASKDLTRAKDYATAKAAWDKLQAATAPSAAAGPAPKWERAASLGRLMEETTSLQGRLTRNLRRLERTKDDNIRTAATLAAFAQAGIYDTHEVKNEADLPKWYAMMAEMRDAAATLSKQYEVGDETTIKTGLMRLEKSCETCHEVFHNE